MVLCLLLILSIPSLLSTRVARRLIVHVFNKRLSPGRVELGGLSVAWTREIVLSDVALVDPHGKVVVSAKSVRTDRGIIGLLSSRPDYGTIRVDGAIVDVERRPDGSVDVLDALSGLTAAPSTGTNRRTALAIVVKGDDLRIASPELAEPISSHAFDASATIVPGKPLDVSVTITDEDRSLRLHADSDLNAPAGTPADQSLVLTGNDWPLALREAGLTAKGRFMGTLTADRRQGRWAATGDATLRSVVADGPILAGDRLAFESVTASCDVTQTAAGWSITKFDVKSPVGELSASGDIPATDARPGRVAGHLDLAAISKRLPLTVRLRDGMVIDKGQLRLAADWTRQGGSDRLQVSANVADLAATERGRPLVLHHPISLSADLSRDKGVFAIQSFILKAAGLDASAKGDLGRGVTLSATVDLAVLQMQARDLVDLGGLDLVGKGRIAADYRPDGGTYAARFAAEFDGFRARGLAAEPISRDHARFEGVADGPTAANHLPAGWHSARLGLNTGVTKATLNAKLADGVTTVMLDGSTSITTPIAARAQGRISMHWSGQAYDIDEVRLIATPSDPGSSAGSASLAAKGRLDLASGELLLTPIGGRRAAGIELAPDGLKVSGIGKANSTIAVDAALRGELAVLDQILAVWTQAPARGVGGGWSGHMALARQPGGRLDFNGEVASANLTAGKPLGPVALAVKGAYLAASDQLDLASLELGTAFGRLAVGGKLVEASSARRADVTGTFEPRWEFIDPLVAAAVEPEARVRATFRPFHVSGPISGGSLSGILKGLEGEVPLDIASAQAFGMKLDATPVVLRMSGGKARFDPIATTLNEGKVAIDADLNVDDPDGLWLRLGKGTGISDAVINEAVSNDLLSYVAPVLSKASNVTGKVSLTLDDAAIPLTGEGSLRVDGQMTFLGVVFQPGPFASEVFSLTGKVTPKMTLQQPLQFQIADGRVKQSGLSIPLPNNAKADLQGSVGFDKTLSIRAILPVTPQMLGNDAAVRQIVGDTKVTVPIGGTISHPAIDRAGFRLALKDATSSVIKRGAKAEVGRLLEQAAPARGGTNAGSRLRDSLKQFEGAGREKAGPENP